MAWRWPSARTSWPEFLGGAGFGLALLALLVLAGFLAALLTLWGEWIELHWELTFPTLISHNMWLLAALVPVLLILLYFLKLKRKHLQVPSTFLWRKSIEDLHVNSFFQWLRRNLLLLLQLLVLLLLGYALANPTHNSESRGRRFIFLLDNSASMSATDAKPTRLEQAKDLLRKRIETLDDSDLAMLIAFNREAQIVQSYTRRKAELRAAVDRVQPTQQPTRLDQALTLAEGQANPRRSAEEGAVELTPPGQMARSTTAPEAMGAEVLIFSDGRVPELTNFSPGQLRIRLELIGTAGTNVAITGLSLRRDDSRLDQFEASVRVLNFTAKALPNELSLLIEVFGKDGRLDRQLKPLNLSARTEQEIPVGPEGLVRRTTLPGDTVPEPLITFTIPDPVHGYVKATLMDATSGGPWQDDLEVDNSAWQAITPVRRSRVLRIGPPNEILDAMLRAVTEQQRAEVHMLAPEGFATTPHYQEALRGDAWDLVIFDRTSPATAEQMPEANTYFIGAAPPLPGLVWADLPVLQGLFIKEFRATHSLLRGIETLQGMTLGEARVLPRTVLPMRASPLMESQSEPVMWDLGRGRFTDLVQTFALVDDEGFWNTNWPKQPAGTLPLFLDNVISQLGRYRDWEAAQQPGIPKVFTPSVAATEATVRRMDPPGGSPTTIQRGRTRELVFDAPGTVGLYEADWGESQPYRFAVNLFDANESDLTPRRDLVLGDETVEADEQAYKRRQEYWPILAAAALALLFLEWLLYQRRIAV